MVNIHHVEPMAPAPDPDALALFQQQWAVYRKFVEHDYGSSTGACRRLGRDAGFAKTEHVFTASPDLLRMFCFSG